MIVVTHPRLRFTDSALEALKWLALVAMTTDHINTVVFDRQYAWAFAVGRLAFPLFAFVLGVNLARPTADKGRAMRRLALWALLAQPFYAVVFGSYLPLNVLFTFYVAVWVITLYEGRKETWAVAAFALAPLLVDYQWAGVACVFAAYAWAKKPSSNAALYMVIALGALTVVNGSLWQWVALPVVLAATQWTFYVPRARWAFYGYYVGHIAVLAGFMR